MRRAILLAGAIGLAYAIGGTSEAEAQLYFGNGRIGIGIGGGYGGGYGGYGGYGNRGYGYPGGGFGYGPGLGSNYMVPGYPYYGNGRPSNSYSYGRSYVRSPAPAPMPPRPGAGLPIKIVSPDDAEVPLTYTVNEYEYTIQPGESQTLVNDREWIISFDRGGDFGTARYTLSPGTYEFALTDKGWEAFHDADVNKLLPNADGAKTTAKNPLPK